MMIISEINVVTATMTYDDAFFDVRGYEAITDRELYDVVKCRAMEIAQDLTLMSQGKGRISVEMIEGKNGFPVAEITSNSKIMNRVFCDEEV
jgi:hypothetical protein